MHIALLESLGISPDALSAFTNQLEEQGHTFAVYEKTTDLQKLREEVREADVVILANMPLPWEALEGADRLKYIDVAFTGTDHVPVAQAAAHGIQVSNASGYAEDAVAELCLGFMIDLLRSIPQTDRTCRQGGTRAGWPARLLKGKTVGFVGAGRIAARTADLVRAFGTRSIGFRRHPAADPAFDRETDSLDELLREADIVSVHTPLTSSTKHMIADRELAAMKPGSYLINTARGPVVDAQALCRALNDGTLAGAAIDVFDQEPPLDPEDPLLQAPNLIVTPHIGFYTEESMDQRAKIVFDNLSQWLQGNWANQVKP